MNDNEISPMMQQYIKDKQLKPKTPITKADRVFAEGVSEDMKTLILERDKKNKL